MSTFFTADTHFGHARILEYQAKTRPFKDLNHMHEVLIARWNEVVQPADTVYHLGDFGFGPAVSLARKRLNGTIRLIIGNHDKIRLEDAAMFRSIDSLKLISENGQKLVLCHYAMRTWQFQSKGAWQLYGHSHGNLPDDINALSLDVGVDAWDMRPVSMAQLTAAMLKKDFKMPLDHHGKDEND